MLHLTRIGLISRLQAHRGQCLSLIRQFMTPVKLILPARSTSAMAYLPSSHLRKGHKENDSNGSCHSSTRRYSRSLAINFPSPLNQPSIRPTGTAEHCDAKRRLSPRLMCFYHLLKQLPSMDV
ncbi:unnamed protein product [Protopolystoma xenopodis]|uniref:Uncharacterized protein n=1 Tax=Protopolystoma xenopodis TaxID=117903 RepID=A0A3S5A5R1_9PLAT|nr:unnamed protein product [Protopolystoma xenopodis]